MLEENTLVGLGVKTAKEFVLQVKAYSPLPQKRTLGTSNIRDQHSACT